MDGNGNLTGIEQDRDKIHVLPLSMIPLEAKVFEGTRMVKNIHLESVLELYSGKGTGSGQVELSQLRSVFRDVPFKDINILNKLAELHSYDVYSLRRVLRKQGIEVNDYEQLRLSPAKQRELDSYMHAFTRPLILKIYGDDEMVIRTEGDVIELFNHPDVQKTRQNLRTFAEAVKISIHEIPKFLLEYGDLFMSISYYRQCLESVGPVLVNFHHSVDEIRTNRALQQDASLVKNCTTVQTKFKKITASVIGRLKYFDHFTKEMWGDMSPDGFRSFGNSVRGSQTAIGGMLCALTVKMNAWSERFPSPEIGGPNKWAEFILADMRQGLDRY